MWLRYVPTLLLLGFLFLNPRLTIAQSQKSLLTTNGFIQNQGQILNQDYQYNEDVLFLFVGNGLKIQLRRTGYSYELFSVSNLPSVKPGKKFFDNPTELAKAKITTSRVDIDFLNANSHVEVISEEPKSELLNYLTCGKEIYDVKSFKTITYKNVYDYIDIEFKLNENNLNPLKYNVILHSGANIEHIKFLCAGATSLKKVDNQIKIKTDLGEIVEKIPFSYYTDEPKQNQPVEFNLKDNIISFACNYNHNRTLIVDPSSNIIFGSYFGGSAIDYCNSTGTDSQNNLYITGHTMSTSNIATAGAFQTTLTGNFDIYLAKFNSTGTIQWSTYFGGSNLEAAYAVYVEPTGGIYVCGSSASTINVASPGAHQTVYGGGIDDAVLAKFNSSGQRLWSTYYGADMHDIAYCLTVDGGGNVIIAGHTESSNIANGIATPGAFSTSFSFASDCYVAKFNANGVRQWGTYYGDTGFEEAWGVASDATNNIIITGWTSSIAGISTPLVHQGASGGGNDAFISKFDPTGANLIWATYYGGLADEQGVAVKVNSGKIFITGNTNSNNAISTPGSYQTTLTIAGPEDVFLTCFNSAGVRQWGTYYGGNGTDYVFDMIVDAKSKLLICGQTLSTNSISTIGAYQSNIGLANTYDGYFAKFSNAGNKLILASYYGSSGADAGKGITLDNNDNLYMVGETSSTVNLTTPGSYMPTSGGGGDGFLAKFCVAPDPLITPVGTATICKTDSYTLSAPNTYTAYAWSTGAPTNSITLTGPWVPGNYYYTVTVDDAYGCTGTSDSAKIVVNNCITELKEENYTLKLKIFPIPAQDFIFIENADLNIPENLCLEIYSSLGELILKNEKMKSNQRIDIRNLTSGIYFLKVMELESFFIKKFIKQ